MMATPVVFPPRRPARITLRFAGWSMNFSCSSCGVLIVSIVGSNGGSWRAVECPQKFAALCKEGCIRSGNVNCGLSIQPCIIGKLLQYGRLCREIQGELVPELRFEVLKIRDLADLRRAP